MIKITYNRVVRGLRKRNASDPIACMGLSDSALNVNDKKIDDIFIVITAIFIAIIHIDRRYRCVVVINVTILTNESNDNALDE